MIPVHDAAIDMRPSPSADSAAFMPVPSWPPSSASSPTSTSSSTSSAVSQERRPSLPCTLLAVNPGVSVGTRKALTPLPPGPPVRAITRASPAMLPLVMKILRPLIR